MPRFRYFLFINLMEISLPNTSKSFSLFFGQKYFLSVSHWYFTGIKMYKVSNKPYMCFSDDSTVHMWNLSKKKLGEILRTKEYFL